MGHQRARSADADLDDIWYYVAKESGSFDRADSFVAPLTDRFYLLARTPYIGRARDDLRAGLRTFSAGQYVIIYRIADEDVIIPHVLHGSRDIESFFHH